MRWTVFFIMAFILLALEVGLHPLWVLPIGPYRAASPSLLLILGVFLCMNTTAGYIVTAMILLGALTDLTQPVGKAEPVRDIVLLGPAALGFLLGGFVIMQLRHLVFRDSVVTLIAMTFAGGLFVQLGIVAVISLRGVVPTEPVPDWQPMSQLLHRTMSVVYSAALAAPLGMLLIRTRHWWGFHAMRS